MKVYVCLLALPLALAAGEVGVKAEYIGGTAAGIAAKSTDADRPDRRGGAAVPLV